MLTKIHIQNFKSLKDVTLDLQPVNLLIGPNNSGKTNLLKALELSLNFSSKLEKLSQEEKQRLSYHFNYGNVPSINLDYNYTDYSNIQQYISCSTTIFWLKSPTRTYHNLDSLQRHTIDEEFRSSFIHLINPNLLISAFPLLPKNEVVAPDAANLVAFLDFLRDQHPDLFQKIQSNLNDCIPEITQIRFENVEPDEKSKLIYGDKTFKKIGFFNSKHNSTFWADEVSEGVLYFVALLCIIHQPNPPKLLLLEEPERGIHPRRIKEVVDFIFSLAQSKDIQVIMTSHHPYILNEFEDIPEAVFVFDKDEEGATQIRNLQKDIIAPSNAENDKQGLPRIKFTQDLAEHWFSGFLGGVPA